jgi:rod shape-determining protein MreB
MNIFSDGLAIDPGTDRTLLYTAKKGIVINEPSVVAVGMNGKSRPHIVAVGEEAGNMLGKTPAQIEVVRPIREGAIVNFEAACAMLKHFIKIGCKRRKLARFQAVIAVPSGITQIEMDAVIEAVKSAGAGKVFLIEGAVAGALGAGLPITEPTCSMVVDIGGGKTEVAVISLGGVVTSRSVRVAGCRMNTAIKNFIRRKYGLLIGNLSAEKIKTTIGNACPNPKENRVIKVKGRHLTSGIPKAIPIGPKDIREAISVEIGTILQTVRSVLEELPPELAADVLEKGILLTGGGALLNNLDQLLSEEIGLAITVPDNPSATVVLGAAKVLEDLNGFNRSTKSTLPQF